MSESSGPDHPGAAAPTGREAAGSDLIPGMRVDADQTELLLPGAVVAEVIAWVTPLAYPQEVPEWLLGAFDWRAMRLPLVAVQCLAEGVAAPEPGPASRIVVVKGLKHHRDLPFYGIAAEDIPQLVAIRPGNVRDPEDDEPRAQDLPGRPVMVGGAPGLIPDLTAVEDRLMAVLPAAGETPMDGEAD
ncbi:chemotaxis protein CheW [Alkalilimnicola ehrlichii MLHE-1]|uniref:Chemosensory pili system protein ChpC n=1 Tax=Alkalilimnicola ehrlichii (strain ATCC BAA-1101 / DSM 17681 / MLHE-1) TaxID=187272 RepID=Q0ABS2_ALKEH|nr:chemotaxis protein CheW [Alkalilimnicola ehrlichii]ABI55715.1 chemosensory pili system protein ChpC [Alkalilimnicola ehrlichii MLHE-1]